MVRGGRVRDLPGVHYRIVRGKKDFTQAEIQVRFQRRSKYGIRDPLRQRVTLPNRLANRVKHREEQELKALFTEAIAEELFNRMSTYFLSKK